jgi:hypothetical protein
MSATEKGTGNAVAVKGPATPAMPAKATPAAKKAPAVARKANKPAVKAPAKPVAKPVAKPASNPLPKLPAKTAVKPAMKPVIEPKAVKPARDKKPKLVRDSFTIPKAEYSVLGELKQRADKLASPAKKGELLRAGIKALSAMADSAFVAALKAVPAIKTGRPAKD